jgi:hypothetical protein
MTLAPRTSKLLAVALLIAAAALGYVLVIEPLTNLYAARQGRIATLAMRASQLGVRAEDAPELKQRLAHLQSPERKDTPFWPGATDAVAAAGLQERVKSLLGDAGAVIESTEVLPPSIDGGLRKIALKVRFEGEIDQLEHVIHGVETMSPSLMVERLTVRAADSPREGAPPLSIELQVFGLAEPPTNARPAS